ncbi:hypothetical protein JVX91_17370 [Pseudomonas sp. PDNC002]|uniref:hypothetical protein n=1 Tax=Pseudomonas sp. PDNC002 TaxID=2811422 RepID=UPI001964EFC3|nr:hypothetical protein [Pseudomonas sp. PDNC002]QRY77378.1 hypothetical protein JVX91_17370 [Pseudomonas sp. PDNC002]
MQAKALASGKLKITRVMKVILLFPILVVAYALIGMVVSAYSGFIVKTRGNSYFSALTASAVVFGIFFGSEIYTYLSWKSVCRSDAGMHFDKAIPVEGFFDTGDGAEFNAESFLKKGYRFVEVNKIRGEGFYRFSYDGSGLSKVSISNLSSEYSYAMRRGVHGKYILTQTTSIQNIQTGDVVGRSTTAILEDS